MVRFETEPGRQLQIDFVVFRRGALPLRAFTAELGYSRYAYVEFTDNERGETLVACLERALHYFGGVPMHVLCDNPKTIVIERNAYGEGLHRYQKAWLDFAKHYGVASSCARRIERRRKARSSDSIATCVNRSSIRCRRRKPISSTSPWPIERVRLWLDEVANCRIHATLKERPVDRFAIERHALRAAAAAVRRSATRHAGAGRHRRSDADRIVATSPIDLRPCCPGDRRMIDLERIDDLCQRLALGTMATHLAHVAEEAARKEWSYQEFFERLLQAEHRERQERSRARLPRPPAFQRSRRSSNTISTSRPALPKR